LEWTTREACDCSKANPLKVSSLKGLPERLDECDDTHHSLTEAKHLGRTDDISRDVTLAYATTKGSSFQQDKAKARSSARKLLEKLLQRTHARLLALTTEYTDKKRGNFKNYSKAFKSILRDAYDKAYVYGLKSTGTSASLTAGGSPLMLPKDKKWIDSAFRQETIYLNRFLTDIKNRKQPKMWPHRIGMYVATIGSVYYAGRVAVTPPNHALFWIAKLDVKICAQCKYMATHGPYTKFNIPITPASGHTTCLANCRCAISVRPVSQEYFDRIRRSVSRETHLRRLKAAR